MAKNVYIVSSRMRLAEEWMYQNETFLKNCLNLSERPNLLSTDGWKSMEHLQGFPSESLMILVELPSRFLRKVKQLYPHYIFISCELN